MMQSFDQSTDNYKLIQKLTTLRRKSLALSSGKQRTLFCSKDLYVFERRAGDDVAVVALSLKAKEALLNAPEVATSLGLAGNDARHDALASALSGITIEGTKQLSLPPQSLSIWLSSSNKSSAFIAAIRPPAATAGKAVTVYGKGFGTGGKLSVAGEALTTSSWADDKIVFNAPLLKHGRLGLEVEAANSGKAKSEMVVVENKLVLVRFVVPDLKLAAGEQLYISGNTSALGAGSLLPKDIAGPMLVNQDSDERPYILAVPMPAGESVELKLAVYNGGGLVRAETKSHNLKMPQLGPSVIRMTWQ
jgi:hypothetical protein